MRRSAPRSGAGHAPADRRAARPRGASGRRADASFPEQVRDALAHLHDPVYLQTHPLAAAATGQAGGRPSAALQRLLTDAIEALRARAPAGGDPAAERGHRLLALRYLEGLTPSEVQRRLAIGRSRYFEEHGRALAAVTALLREQWDAPEQDAPAAGRSGRAGLPVPLTSLVGRETAVDEVARRLGRDRLLTLTGTAGVGKTRLAVEAARRLGDRPGAGGEQPFPGGLWFVELAALADPGLVPSAVLAALGLREAPGEPAAETLVRLVRGRGPTLLILDNCEHLVDGCADLAAAMLGACADLRVLATSREPLGVPGEAVFVVPPLEVGPGDGGLEQVARSPAVQLFVERAAAVQHAFVLSAESAPAVAQVCAHLDGLPLALEMAAAWVRVLPVEQIRARLDDRLRLLADGGRTSPPRQRTLRSALDWSHDLLTVPQQALFRRLGVFAGGWTLQAAEAVCADHPAPAAPDAEIGGTVGTASSASPRVTVPASGEVRKDEVLDLLARLVDKSLVVAEAHEGTGRFRMLETVREYARERLAASGEAEALERRHAAYFLGLAEAHAEALVGPVEARRSSRLEREDENLRTALRWALAREEPTVGLRLAIALREEWELRGSFAEAQGWLSQLLALDERGPSSADAAPLRAQGLRELALFAYNQSDLPRAAAYLTESIALARKIDDRESLARSANRLGQVERARGNRDEAVACHEEALRLFRAAGNQLGAAIALMGVAQIDRDRGDYSAAASHLAEGLALWRAIDQPRGIAVALNQLGRVAREIGDVERAAACFDESLAIRRQLGDRPAVAFTLQDLGEVARDRGDYARAAALMEESLALKREWRDTVAIGYSLHGLGVVARETGDHARAADYLAESLAIRQEHGDAALIGTTRLEQGLLALATEDTTGAIVGLREALELLRPLGNRALIARCLEGLAQAIGEPERAARLLGAADGLRATAGVVAAPVDRTVIERTAAALRSTIGEVRYCAAWETGRRSPPETTIADVLAVEDPPGVGALA